MILIPMEHIQIAIDSLDIYLRYNIFQYDYLLDICEMHGSDNKYRENRELKVDLMSVLKPVEKRIISEMQSGGRDTGHRLENEKNAPNAQDG